MENASPRLLIPQLKPFYDRVEPLSWALIRLTVGLMIIPHGWPKLMAGIGPTAANALAKRGIEPAEPLAIVLILLETVGGLCVALGLFTRFFAAAITIEMAVIAGIYWPRFGWTGPGYGRKRSPSAITVASLFISASFLSMSRVSWPISADSTHHQSPRTTTTNRVRPPTA